MQERIYKTVAAAQVSRWVAQETGHGDFFGQRTCTRSKQKILMQLQRLS
jgi:hypothetical protein